MLLPLAFLLLLIITFGRKEGQLGSVTRRLKMEDIWITSFPIISGTQCAHGENAAVFQWEGQFDLLSPTADQTKRGSPSQMQSSMDKTEQLREIAGRLWGYLGGRLGGGAKENL